MDFIRPYESQLYVIHCAVLFCFFLWGQVYKSNFFCRHSFGRLGEATPLKTMAGETLIYVKLINPFSVTPGFSIPLRPREMVAVLFSN